MACDAYTVLMLHCNGTDASTTFTDDGVTGHTVTANGNAQIDTAQSVFGGASGLFDGTADYLTVPDSDNWDMGSGDFTLDLRIRFNSIAAVQGIIQQSTSGADGWTWRFVGGGSNLLILQINGVTIINKGWSPSTATWYHVALTRSGNSWRYFIDGTQLGTTVTDATGMPAIATGLKIGQLNDGGTTYDFNGWMDEIRISKGIARWTADFTPEVVEYCAASASQAPRSMHQYRLRRV